jgi:uncharacterized delta-60 repeat protein
MRSRARAAILLALWAILPGPDAEAAVCAVTTPIGSGGEEVRGLAVQSDGKIVAVGYSLAGANDDFAVVRYNPDLTLDTSFQGTGKVVTPIGTGNDRAEAVAIQPDGKIVVVGYAFMGTNNDIALARYNSNGSLDLGFDGDGKTTLNLGSSDDELFDVAIQTDGKIVVVGRTSNSNYDFLVARFDSSGALDPGFASGGIQTFSIGSFDEAANAVALQSDGKIVVAGTEFDPADNDVLVARFNTNGTFDTTFAGVGWLTNGPLQNDHGNDVAIQSDGKIVIAGDSVVGADRDVAVMRLNTNGTGDTSFNLTGFVRTDLGSANDLGEALQIQSDGKILVAGTGGGAGIDMWALRYDSAGAPDLSFDADGKASVGLVGSTNAYAVGIGSSGSIYVAGSAVGGALNYDFAVGRFNSDGSSPCSEIYLHPVGPGSASAFTPMAGCTAGSEWQCVNDQAGDAPTGFPAPTDNATSFLRDNSTGRAMFRLADLTIPPGAIVNRIEIFARVGKQGGTDPAYKLSYQRMGFDVSWVDGPTMTTGQTCCFDTPSWIVGGIAWPPVQLDALEIGLVHTATGTLDVSQLYAQVTYMLPPPSVNYRSIGTAPDYSAGTVMANLNSEIVIGSGTQWRTAKRGRGDRIQIDGVDYTILDVASDIELTLTSSFTGASGGPKPYTISRQYNNPSAWEDCIDGNPCTFFPVASSSLVADNRREIGIVYDDGAPYNQQLVIDGATTDATHDIVLTVNPADRHFGRANVGVAIDLGGAGSAGVLVTDNFVTLEWLEVRNTGGVGIDVAGLGPLNRIMIRNNLVHDVPASGIRNTTGVLEVYNNVVYNVINNGIELGPASGVQVYNNTVYNGGGNGISGGTSPKIRNNIAHTFTGPDFSFGSLDLSSSNNLSSDTTATSASPGGGDRPNVPLTGGGSVDFVSTTPGSEDLHLLTTSAAKDAGAALGLFNNDIDDGQRPALWDIGADEFGATGGPGVNYFSIGTNPGILASGSATVSSGSTTVTFGVGLPANVGIGDKLVLDPGGVNEEVFYVLSRTSGTEMEVQAPAALAHPGDFFQIRRAFNTLPDWESAREGDLVAEDRLEVGVAYNDSPFLNGVTIVGSTTDPAHYMMLTVARDERHTGVAGTGAVVDGGNTSIGEIVVADDYTVVEWMEVTRVRGATSAGVKVQASGVLLGQLLVYDSSAGAVLSGVGGNSFTIRNSILYRNDRDGIAGNVSTDSFTVLNCTVFGNSQQGVDAVGSIVVDVRNTIAMGNLSGDFAVGGGSQTNNMSSDNTAIGFPLQFPANEFVSPTTFAENLHLRAGAVAAENGVDLSSLFQNDVDDQTRPTGALWDIGADELGGGPAPSVSSFNNQNFTVGGPLLPAATITISDDTTTPTITAANDLRIHIPFGFPMRFDSAQTTLSIGGPAWFKVASQVKAYEDSDRTVVLDVVMDFAASDQITVDFLRFWSYTAPAPADNLELEVGNDGVVSATDDKTITIFPDTFANLSSDDHQVFTQFQPPTPAVPFTVSEGTGTSIIPGTDIRVRIPAGFNMTWDSGGPISFGGPAAGKVTLPVIYEDLDRTLRIPVTLNFVSGDYVTVSGARFQGFVGISPTNNLLLDVGTTDSDDKTIEIAAASDVAFFTATAKDQYVKLEWLQPASGICDNVLILRRDDGFEPAIGDGVSFTVDNRSCTPTGAKDTVDDPLPLFNGTLYTYAAFVEYSGGTYTDGEFVKARPMDTVGTPVQWAYSTGATAMAPPGLRLSGGASYVYAVSNDYILHSMKGGSTGGDWPAGWKPYKLGGPAQARPPVIPYPVGGAASGAALLGSQDGSVYAIDAVDGSEEWKRPISSRVQAAPAGHFGSGTFNIVIVGTRDTSLPNSLEALDKDTGNPVWSFTNSSVAQGGDDKEIGFISGSASIDYGTRRAFFASHTRAGVMGSNKTLWCVDFSSGSPVLRWSLALGDIEGSPVLWNNAVYVGTVSGVLYAVDRYAATGTVNWSRAIGDGQIKGFVFPEFGSNRVLVSTTSKVTSTEDQGGAYNPFWQLTSTDIPGPSTPVFVPGTGKVLVGSSDGHLYQFDAFTPLPTTRVQLGDGSSAVGVPSVDIVKSMIYVGTDEGVIYGVTFPLL